MGVKRLQGGYRIWKIQERIINITDKLENNCVIGAIRQGMILMIPLLVVGYMSAMLINLPIPAFQQFLSELWGGCIRAFLEMFMSV